MMQSVANLISKKTNAVYDYKFVKRLSEVSLAQWMETSPPFSCKDEYLEKFNELILSSTLNSVTGLDQFKRRDLINGTTQAFDECYLRNKNRRLRILKGEYAYHKRVNPDFLFIDDAPLEKGDYIVMSYPFCTTGDKPEKYEEILEEALKLDIPVEIDCAYFGTCLGLNIDLSHKAIKAVSFSLSKGMGLGDIRSGMRYSNYDDNLPIAQQNNYNHSVLLAAKIGLHMMEKFSFDFIPSKYRESQLSVCEDLGLVPTPCMHLALGDKENYPDYIIDGIYYRVGIRNAVKARSKGEA